MALPQKLMTSVGEPIHDLLEAALSPTSLRLGRPSTLELPGGWRLHHRLEAKGRRLIEIYDVSRALVGFVASTNRTLVSVDAAWRGLTLTAGGDRRWWTLALGHAALQFPPSVTFMRRNRDQRLIRTVVVPLSVEGMWVTMVSGRQTSVSLRQGSRQHHHRVWPTFQGRP